MYDVNMSNQPLPPHQRTDMSYPLYPRKASPNSFWVVVGIVVGAVLTAIGVITLLAGGTTWLTSLEFSRHNPGVGEGYGIVFGAMFTIVAVPMLTGGIVLLVTQLRRLRRGSPA